MDIMGLNIRSTAFPEIEQHDLTYWAWMTAVFVYFTLCGNKMRKNPFSRCTFKEK